MVSAPDKLGDLPDLRAAFTAQLAGSSQQASATLGGGNTQSATVSISLVDIAGNSVRAIDGDVVYANAVNIPFSLSGTLFKDAQTATVDASLTDNSNNFDVPRFQIATDPAKTRFNHA